MQTNTGSLKKSGLFFDGWSKSQGINNSKDYDGGQKIEQDQLHTSLYLYVHWSTNPSNIVTTYYTNQGYFKDGSQRCTVAQEPGKFYKLPGDDKLPVHLEHKTNLGWFTLPVGGESIDPSTTTVDESNPITELFIHWGDQKATVTFKDADTKEQIGVPIDEIIGDNFVLPTQPDKPYKTKLGWFRDEGSATNPVTTSTEVTDSDKDTTI